MSLTTNALCRSACCDRLVLLLQCAKCSQAQLDAQKSGSCAGAASGVSDYYVGLNGCELQNASASHAGTSFMGSL